MRILSKYVFTPLLERRAHGSTFTRLKELERTQWLSRDELKMSQEERLQALIRHAYENVPFYYNIFQERKLTPRDIKTTDDLVKLPILTRSDVRQNFDNLMAKNYNPRRAKPGATGGTTGEPLRFMKQEDVGWEWGAFYRGMKWYGIEAGDKQALFWSVPIYSSGLASVMANVGRFLRNSVLLSAFEMSEEKMKRFALKLRRFEPKVLIGYPSAIYIFASYIKNLGIQYIKPEVVITTAEKLYDYQKGAIKDAFDCEVFEYYGSREIASLAYECPQHHGYHISVENVVLEFTKDNGQMISPGELGKVLVTDLHNYAMPFIRYEIGDLAIPSDRVCPCGRSLPLIESIEGRITDIIVCQHGFILGALFPHLLKDFSVRQYQVIQESLDKIIIKIVPAEGFSQEQSQHIVETVQHLTGPSAEVEIDLVDDIPPSKSSGKRRVVISKVPFRLD